MSNDKASLVKNELSPAENDEHPPVPDAQNYPPSKTKDINTHITNTISNELPGRSITSSQKSTSSIKNDHQDSSHSEIGDKGYLSDSPAPQRNKADSQGGASIIQTNKTKSPIDTSAPQSNNSNPSCGAPAVQNKKTCSPNGSSGIAEPQNTSAQKEVVTNDNESVGSAALTSVNLEDSERFVVFVSYKRRFWILFIFSLLALLQCLEWNTWGPISESVVAVHKDWNSGTVAMMSNWGTITFCLFVFPLSWLAQNKGLRAGVLTCGGLIAVGTGIRCIAQDGVFFTISCHICAFLVGTAGTLVMAAPSLIASVWFPPRQRITAVAVMQVANQFGNLGAYLEPLIVREPSSGATEDEIKSDINRLMYIAFGCGAVLFVLMLIYFPSKPPTPPSISSTIERGNFKTTIKAILKNKNVMCVILSYSLSYGPVSAWISVMNYSLYDLNFDQNEAMWIGILIVLVSGAVALLFGRIADIIYGHIKISLFIIIFSSVVFFYWFYLISQGTIPNVKWQVFFSIITAYSCSFAACPLFFELAVELAYPLHEGIVTAAATALLNFVGMVFLFMFFIPNIGYEWVIYLLMFTSIFSAVPLLFVEENYSRSKIDRGIAQSPYQAI